MGKEQNFYIKKKKNLEKGSLVDMLAAFMNIYPECYFLFLHYEQ